MPLKMNVCDPFLVKTNFSNHKYYNKSSGLSNLELY